jgi:hypothetical protein
MLRQRSVKGGISLLKKSMLLVKDWTPCPAALLWQGALRSSRSNIDFFL